MTGAVIFDEAQVQPTLMCSFAQEMHCQIIGEGES